MPLPEFEREEDIPEMFREYYVEREGTWVPNIEDNAESRKTEDDVNRLKQAHERSKAERNEYRDQLQKFKQMLGDHDPAEIQHLFEERENEKEEQLRREKKYEEAAAHRFERQRKALEQQIEQMQAQLAKELQEKESLYGDYKTMAIDEQLRNAALAAGADPKKIKFLLPEARNVWQLDPESRKPIAIGKASNGEEFVIQDFTMASQMKEILQEYPDFALPNRGDSTVGHQRANGANGNVQVNRAELARDSVRVWQRAKEEAAKRGGVDIEVVDN